MMTSNNPNNKGKWTCFSLKDLDQGVSSSSAILMGHHIVMIVHDSSSQDSEEESIKPATILAVDLHDNTVREHKMQDFYYHKEYSLVKYKHNQIIKFGGKKGEKVLKDIYWITIKSFNPFSLLCEEVEIDGDDSNGVSEDEEESEESEEEDNDDEKRPALYRHTAEIYKNHMYVYGGRGRAQEFYDGRQSDLWKFHLKNLTWTLCETKGQGPGVRENAKSFIIEGNMYIYGGKRGAQSDCMQDDIFVLNLKSLTWTQLQQTALSKIYFPRTAISGDVSTYKGNFLLLGSQEERLCSWNIKKNTWSDFAIQPTGLTGARSNLVVYKNFLIVNGGTKKLSMAIMDLDRIGLPIEESPEEEHLRSLFMEEQESDVKFKIEDRIVPAHKQVLIENSKYFANLFESGMAESRQEIINIQDYGYDVFQEFLRYLYCKEAKLDADLAIKLLKLSDRYLQEDLNEKCMDFLKHNLDSDNVYKILDFAREENISHLANWCLGFLESNINISNVSNLIQYIEEMPNPEVLKENPILREKAFEIVFDNFLDALQEKKGNTLCYENFLIKNVDLETIVSLANFIFDESSEQIRLFAQRLYKSVGKDALKKVRDIFEQNTINLRKRVLDFADQNFEILQEKDMIKDIEKNFFVELVKYEIQQRKSSQIQEDGKMVTENDNQAKKGLKRREPSNNESVVPEENPRLKQTKKESPAKEYKQ